MSADERALLMAIHAAPADDLPRLMYADWLDDLGQTQRASFIRIQCDWHRSLVDPAHEQYRIHLYNRLQDEFTDGIPGPPDFGGIVNWEEYRRGFPTVASINVDYQKGIIEEVLLAAPLFELELYSRHTDYGRELLAQPPELTQSLRQLILNGRHQTLLPPGLLTRFRDILVWQ